MTELDPNLVGNLESQARRDGLYGTGYEGTDADRIEAEQAGVTRLLRDNGPSDLVAAIIAAAQVQWRKDEYYRVVGDTDVPVSYPVLGDDLSQWTLDHIVTWCPSTNDGTSAQNSQSVSGSVAAPAGANTVIASLTPTVEGLYDVVVSIELTGTAEVLPDNLKLIQQNIGTLIATLPTITGEVNTVELKNVHLLNVVGDTVQVMTNAAGAAGSVYAASLTISPAQSGLQGNVEVILGGSAISGGNMFKIPAVIQASKNITKTAIELPVTQPEVTSLGVTGTVGDRVAVIFVYKRGG